ncbi:hypothetical protein BKI52_39420 [marine bacterium AO1-C]|nr:hypothetical protein BKI52_39420 [marine bacterium AO1-C]
MKKLLLTPKTITLTLLWIIATIGLIIYQTSPKTESKLINAEVKEVISPHQAKIPTTGAFEALGRYSFQRTYPYKKFPVETLQEELARYKRNGASFRTHQQSEWSSLGPHNIGGRTLAICLNPQNSKTMYAGTAGGGLWRSYSGGEGIDAWDQIATGFAVKAVSAVAIPKDDSSTVYIGTGEVYRYKLTDGGRTDRLSRGTYGVGLLKSTDAGKTWTQSLSWPKEDITGVQKIRINPKKSQTVMAATTEGLYVSYNAGTSWSKTLDVPMVTDILINTKDTSVVLAACGVFKSANYGLYRSADGGKNWTKITNGFPTAYSGKVLLDAAASFPDTVYASVGAVDASGGQPSTTYLLRSADQGVTWELKSDTDYSIYQYWFAHYVLAHDTDANKVLTAGVDVWRSGNQGSNLVKVSDWRKWNFNAGIGEPEGTGPDYIHGDHHDAVSDPNNPDVVYLACDGGVFRTDNFGSSYTGLNGGLQTVQFYSIASGQDDSLAIGGGLQDNASIFYNGNKEWRRVIGGDGMITRYNIGNDNEVYATAQFLYLNRSSDKGQNFTVVLNFQTGTPASTGTHFVAPYALSPVNPKVIYAGGGAIYRSTNRGNSWVLPNGTNPVQDLTMPIASIGLSYFDVDKLVVATAPRDPSISLKPQILYSNDAGASFKNVTGNLPDRLAIDVEFDPNNDDTFYVVFSGFGTGHVYRTQDAGATWENISGNLPNVPHSCIFIPMERPNLLFVGNDLGVYVSEDGGTTWEAYNKGLPYPANVVDMSYNYNTGKMQIGTHGNGAFQVSLAEYNIQLPAVVTGLETVKAVDFEFTNAPNPVVSEAKISYQLRKNAAVNLTIFDTQGRKIRTLVNKQQTSGTHQIFWNRTGILPGMYKMVLQTGKQRVTKNILVK